MIDINAKSYSSTCIHEQCYEWKCFTHLSKVLVNVCVSCGHVCAHKVNLRNVHMFDDINNSVHGLGSTYTCTCSNMDMGKQSMFVMLDDTYVTELVLNVSIKTLFAM